MVSTPQTKLQAQNGQKSEIEVLEGEGDRFQKSLRDRAKGLTLEEDDQEIEMI
jgi:hypothetical protein